VTLVRRLSLGADPLDGESLPGFVMRVSGRMRFRNADRLAGMAGLKQPGSAVTAVDLGPLGKLVGTSPVSLVAAAYRPTERPGHHRFLGGAVRREFLRLGHRRACPLCLAGSVHHRASWDFALATACPEHGVRLVERCHRCGRKPGWTVSDLSRCRCNADLRNAPAVPVPGREAADNRRLLELVGADTVPWLSTALAGCDRADLVGMVMVLGMFVTGWTKPRRVEILVAAGPDTVARVVRAGLEALEDWPVSIGRCLDLQGAGADARPGRFGVRKWLGELYDWVAKMDRGAARDVLVGVVADHFGRKASFGARSGKSAFLSGPEPLPVVGLQRTAEMLGVSPMRVKRMMAAGMLPEVSSKGGGAPMLIDRAAVERMARVVPGALDLAATAAALGISKARVRRLVDGGILVPVQRADTAERWGTWAFARADVDALLRRVSVVSDDAATGMPTVSFERVAERLLCRGVDLVGMVGMVSDGRLPVAELDDAAIGLKRLRFASARVEAICREMDGEGTLTLWRAAERMGLKWEVVANLIARGILPSRDGCVLVVDADRFVAGHVIGSVLAREMRTSPRALEARLALRGIRPVVGLNVDGSRQNIYRRGDLSG
jgi:hypothetical protein